MTAERPTLLAAAAVLVVAGGLPLLAMLAMSVATPDGFGLGAYASLVDSGRPWLLLLRSVGVGAIATGWAVLIGWPTGVLCERTDLPGRGFLTLLFSVPFVVPTYIHAIAWARVLGRDGLVVRLLGDDAGSSTLLFSLIGSGLVLGSCFAPLVLILTRASLRTVDPRLEEVARLSAGWPATLRGITLPLALPGTVLAAGLVFLLAVGDLAVPTYLRVDVFPTESFTQFAAAYRFSTATALALPLVLLAFLVLRAETWLVPERVASLRPVSTDRPRPMVPLGRARWPSAALL
ncbi:MAG: ABC transporter permease, partial [Myxococcota bacterium]